MITRVSSIIKYHMQPISGHCSHFIFPENQTFSGVFREYEMGTMTRNGLIEMKKFNIQLEFQTKHIGVLDASPGAKLRNKFQYRP